MGDEPFPTNARTATAMWLLGAVGVIIGIALDSIAVMIIFGLVGIAIHFNGLVQDAQ